MLFLHLTPTFININFHSLSGLTIYKILKVLSNYSLFPNNTFYLGFQVVLHSTLIQSKPHPVFDAGKLGINKLFCFFFVIQM